MKSFKQLTTVLLAVTFVWCSLSLVQAEKPKSKAITVPKILSVSHQLQKSNPPSLVLDVVGEVPTGGYTDVILERTVYVKPPEDGIQDYYLKAKPPTGIAITVISEVKASDVWTDLPAWVKGVRVHGVKDGIQVVYFDQEREMEPVRRTFAGTSSKGSFDEALSAALAKLNQELGEGGVADATSSWKVVRTSGQTGGIAGLNQLKVVISAERQPPWQKKQSRKQKRTVKPVGKIQSTRELKTSER
ncbi:hypothetical protein [Gimesia panareensis]|uniref:Uncharacterized protein n=1 Tax=Gimesia panareensis TaxID=2527978 RepID=A0A517PZU4_9PLAN|nr:hypothetical protein [Gimesia panareensis]QDT24877.1 hypothetical protein Enr10x_01690 [Gimesia panareensis]QDU47823.1 hypothetical protein Pan110_01330 [Gimesia panareensis]